MGPSEKTINPPLIFLSRRMRIKKRRKGTRRKVHQIIVNYVGEGIEKECVLENPKCEENSPENVSEKPKVFESLNSLL